MKRSREPDDVQHQPSLSAASVNTISDDSTGSGPAIPYEHSNDEGLPPRSKIVNLDPSQSDAGGAAHAVMICQLHRDKLDFPSYDAYEAHYNREHLNRCLECHKNFPSPFYLGLHTDEWHDPFVAVKRDRGEHTYACFVEGCERKCGSSDKRRRHLIDKHGFPNNFFFNITQYGIDGRQSLLLDGGRRQHRRRSSLATTAQKDIRKRAASITKHPEQASQKAGSSKAAPKTAPSQRDKDAMEEEDDDDDDDDDDSSDEEEDEEDSGQGEATARRPKQARAPDVEMDDLAGAMSAMTFVPRSVRFGRGGKSGFARR